MTIKSGLFKIIYPNSLVDWFDLTWDKPFSQHEWSPIFIVGNVEIDFSVSHKTNFAKGKWFSSYSPLFNAPQINSDISIVENKLEFDELFEMRLSTSTLECSVIFFVFYCSALKSCTKAVPTNAHYFLFFNFDAIHVRLPCFIKYYWQIENGIKTRRQLLKCKLGISKWSVLNIHCLLNTLHSN